MHGHVLQPVVEVVRERSREDVRVLRRVRDAPARHRLMHVAEVDAGDVQAAAVGRLSRATQLRELLLAAVAGADERHVLAARDAERQPLDPVGDAVLAVRERRRRDVAGERRNRLPADRRGACGRSCPAARTATRSARA